jgi:sugar phosphate permease
VFAGFASDRWAGGRRAPVIALLLLALGGFALLYDHAVARSWQLTVASLALIGFCLAGPQTLLVGSAPIDLARGGRPAAAVGFVNAFGYLGAFLGDQATGYLVEHRGWHVAVLFWAGAALAAALVVAPLWRARAEPG